MMAVLQGGCDLSADHVVSARRLGVQGIQFPVPLVPGEIFLSRHMDIRGLKVFPVSGLFRERLAFLVFAPLLVESHASADRSGAAEQAPSDRAGAEGQSDSAAQGQPAAQGPADPADLLGLLRSLRD